MRFSCFRGVPARSRVIAAALSVVLVAMCGDVLQAETTDLSLTTRSWDGFGADFDPRWFGDRERVEWSRYATSGMLSMSVSRPWDGYRGDFVYHDKPIELIRSHRSASVNSEARSVVPGDYGDAQSKESPSTRLEGPWTQKLARFAEVIDLDDLVLSSGRSVAEQISDVSDEYFSVDGRVAAATLIDLVDRTNSTASATASSVFEADYLVNHPVSFDLSGTLSGWGDVDLKFLVRNNRTGELVHLLRPTDFGSSGLSYDFSVNGEFAPGSYKFSLSATSDGRVTTSGEYEPGDQGEFSLDFSASPIGEFTPPPSSMAVPVVAPEPASVLMLLCLFPLALRRQR